MAHRSTLTTLAAFMIATMTPGHATADKIDAAPCHTVRRIATTVGWPRRELDKVTRIAWRESHCNPKALNSQDPTIYGSRGIMQINGSNVRWLVDRRIIRNADDLYNPTRNLRAALALWKLYGWRPWAGSSSTS